jgi:hypothetical protein
MPTRPWPTRYEVTLQYADGKTMKRTVMTGKGDERARSLVLATIPNERVLESATVVVLGPAAHRADGSVLVPPGEVVDRTELGLTTVMRSGGPTAG